MEEKDYQLIKKETSSVQKRLIGELFLAENMQDILTFTQVYACHFIPLLHYSVRHLDHFDVARIFNASITIDRLLALRSSEIVNRQVSSEVIDFIDKSKIKDNHTLMKLHLNLSSVQKHNISMNLLFMLSLVRGSYFAFYLKNKMYLNQGIGWINVLRHYVKAPHLAFMFTMKDIESLENEIAELKKCIMTHGSELDEEIKDIINQECLLDKGEELDFSISYVGLKVDWLEAKSLINYIKYLKTSKTEFIDKAIHYANVLLETLSSNIEYSSLIIRNKLEYPGPNISFEQILNSYGEKFSFQTPLNFGILVKKSDGKREFLLMPTNTSFYLNNSVVNKNNDKPILEDTNFVLDVHNRGIKAIISIIKYVSHPNDSEYANQMRSYKDYLTRIQEVGLDDAFLREQLMAGTYADSLAKAMKEKDSGRLFASIMVATIVTSLSAYLIARGWSENAVYISHTLPLITDVVVKKIYDTKINELIKELIEDSDQAEDIEEEDEYESFAELQNDMNEMEKTSDELIQYINMEGLVELHKMTGVLKEIIIKSESIEEVNNKIKDIYDLD